LKDETAMSDVPLSKDRTILVVDDDRTGRETLVDALTEHGYEVMSAATGPEALELLRQNDIDMVLTDLRMPGMDGLEVLTRAKKIRPDVFVILVTAFATVDTAIAAMKKGAYDYVMKPIDLRSLLVLLERAGQSRDLILENRQLKDQLGEKYDFSNIIGRSPVMQAIYDQIRQVADTHAVVLIEGESGTGKELVANAIHVNSSRRERPFIKVNCAALPETLLESELFGHERGAFTGALEQRKGRFELADGGTLFLDEIADLSPGTQAKLLRVLQNYEFERVGGTQTLHVDVRIIAATNADLSERVKQGRFREATRRHSPARRAFLQAVCRTQPQRRARHQRRGDERAHHLPLARQCPRASELHREHGGDVHRVDARPRAAAHRGPADHRGQR